MKKTLLFAILLFTAGCSTAVSQNPLVIELKERAAEVEDVKIEPPAVKMLFFGDMMLDRNVKRKIDKFGEKYLFEKLDEENFFAGYDIVSANLEGPFADFRRKTSKSIAFRFEPKLISMLQERYFNLFNLANNHSLDMGRAGLRESEKNLDALGIDYYGDGYGLTASSTLVKEIKGYSIAFVGINDTYFPLDKNKIRLQIENGKKLADFVIVNIHWGEEYKTKSNKRQEDLAHLMIDAGADVIIGHHPHVVQEIEIYKDKPIFYSLGNFIFDQYFSAETQQGLAVALTLRENAISWEKFLLKGDKSQISLYAD